MKMAVVLAVTGILVSGACLAQTPGECYDIGVDFAQDEAQKFCGNSYFANWRREVPRECVDAAISGCENTLILAIEAHEEDCKRNISRWSYLKKEVFKRKTCAKMLE